MTLSNYSEYREIIDEYKSGIAFVISEYTAMNARKLEALSLNEVNDKALKLLKDTRYNSIVKDDLRLYVFYADRALISLYYAATKVEDNETASLASVARAEIDRLKGKVGR